MIFWGKGVPITSMGRGLSEDPALFLPFARLRTGRSIYVVDQFDIFTCGLRHPPQTMADFPSFAYKADLPVIDIAFHRESPIFFERFDIMIFMRRPDKLCLPFAW